MVPLALAIFPVVPYCPRPIPLGSPFDRMVLVWLESDSPYLWSGANYVAPRAAFLRTAARAFH